MIDRVAILHAVHRTCAGQTAQAAYHPVRIILLIAFFSSSMITQAKLPSADKSLSAALAERVLS